MRSTILLTSFALLSMGAAHQARAQRNGGPGPAQMGHAFSGGNHEFHGNRGGQAFHRNFNRNRSASPYGYGYAYLPSYDDGYMPGDVGNDYAYQPAPPAYDQQPSQPVQPPAPEKPSHPYVKEFTWPATGNAAPSPSPTSSESEPQTFTIVLKNGSTLSATMVLASADSLHYVDTDGKLWRVAISEVDRAATLKLDRARNLNLYLPAAD